MGMRGDRPGQFRWIVVMLMVLMSTLAQAPPPTRADDAATAVLQRLNWYRAWLGAPPLQRDPALDAAARAHLAYLQQNQGDPSLTGLGLHREQPGKPGYTGDTSADRAKAQGYGGDVVTEDLALGADVADALDWFLATVEHRLPLLDPRIRDIGFGWGQVGTNSAVVFDMGAPSWSTTATPAWVVWPVDGATGVAPAFDGEVPDPFPGASYPLGYPITVSYLGPGQVTFTDGALFHDNQAVPTRFQPGTGWLSRQAGLLVALAPLQPGGTYHYVVHGQVDGQPFTISGTFRVATNDGESLGIGGLSRPDQLPGGVARAPLAVQGRWWRDDAGVFTGMRQGGWLWGPDVLAVQEEPYREAPGGKRTVVYFDKGRLELNGDGQVTAGLLVRDMILGAVQTGDATFTPQPPATLPLAGDPAPVNPDAPTYASLHQLAAVVPGRSQPSRVGQPVTAVLHRDGSVSDDPQLGSTTIAWYDPVTGVNVAAVFWDWLQQQPWDWLSVLGHPLSEPYWIRTRVGGREQWVLVQAFERRVLTETPSNPPGWQIECNNAGRDYLQWRAGQAVPGS
ncbi:CAP domain-containing protein [Thermorudis peleae]|uniref:CAP domain-containing protein n=1 Tax=Thermorudis peleae TaxID=1382356 RepID=UPI00057123CA|nr:CAP domain-containing protein [Thermorudis peleae]